MVAYTSPDCIPYFECSDPVCLNTGTTCEHDSVWCQQAEIIESRLDEFDTTVTRAVTTVPMVLLQTNVSFRHTVQISGFTTVEFTETVVDTDSMADLDNLPTGFTVNTPGLYEVVVYLFGVTETLGSSMGINVTFSLNPVNPGLNGVQQNSIMTTYLAVIADIQVTPQIHMVIPFFAGQVGSVAVSTGGSVGDYIQFSYAMVGATWMADLPT